MALSYGPIKPVPENRLQTADLLQTESIRPIITPGHATHHVSYQMAKYLFAGETGGVFMSLPEDRFYLRPATPPRFFLGDALQSVDALIAGHPRIICYGHFGVHANAVKMLQIHREQLEFWEKLLGAERHKFEEAEQIAECMKVLIKEDPLMITFNQLPPDVQEREMYFLKNSIKGYLGYLGSKVQG
jgi:glyoxylase-like metal-dependent hydrolase (beta-lactamase superfamily II)